MEDDTDSRNIRKGHISSGNKVVNLNFEDERGDDDTNAKRNEEQCITENANVESFVQEHADDQQVQSTEKKDAFQMNETVQVDSVTPSEKTTEVSLKFVHIKNNMSSEAKEQWLNDNDPAKTKHKKNRLQGDTQMVGNSDTEEGELDDSGDETCAHQQSHQESGLSLKNPQPSENQTLLEKPDVNQNEDDAPSNELREGVNKITFGIDEVRPEEEMEQLDYDEDVVENKESNQSQKARNEFDGEVKSEGEIISDEGEIREDEDDKSNDFEEGETRDHPGDVPQETKVCKFFELGTCTWGEHCRFVHPGVNDKGNYDMFKEDIRREKPAHREIREPIPPPFWNKNVPAYPHHMSPPPPPIAETAWERGLRHAKELKRRAIQRKVHEPDFVQKREIISLNVALNEDRDMEFVDHRSLADANKGYDPFQEIEEDEYAVPPPEELRRGRLMRDDKARKAPPPHFRNGPPVAREGRPPPPIIPLHPEPNPRDKRSPNMHHHPALRRISPSRMRYESEKDRFPVHNPARDVPLYGQQRSGDRDKRERFDDRMHQRGRRRPDEVTPSSESDRRNLSDSKDKDYRESSNQMTSKNPNVGVARSDQWSDPWARARPTTRGKNKENAGSRSSSSSSVSGSSSRSSSRSSYSSHSSYSGSSRSSSRSSATSRSSSYSSNSDTSRSPSPTKTDKEKRKPLGSKQQNVETASTSTEQKKGNVVSAKNTNPTVVNKDSSIAKVSEAPKTQSQEGIAPSGKSGSTPIAKKVQLQPRGRQRKKTVAKGTMENKRTSSSSSEFSHTDSSTSRSPSKGKTKSDSGSDSRSSSSDSSDVSSSGSPSSDSEDDKPKSRKGKTTVGTKLEKKPEAMVPAAGTKKNGKVKVPSKPGRKDVQMTISEKHAGQPVTQVASRKRSSADISEQSTKGSNRRVELLEQLKAVEDAIARKRAKMT